MVGHLNGFWPEEGGIWTQIFQKFKFLGCCPEEDVKASIWLVHNWLILLIGIDYCWLFGNNFFPLILQFTQMKSSTKFIWVCFLAFLAFRGFTIYREIYAKVAQTTILSKIINLLKTHYVQFIVKQITNWTKISRNSSVFYWKSTNLISHCFLFADRKRSRA